MRTVLNLLLILIVPLASAANPMPKGFVALESIAPSIQQDIRYFGKQNFLGTRVDGYAAARCILTRPAAEALARVQAELQPQGMSLKVFDCYRPQRAVLHFMHWARQPDDPVLRAHYYPNLSKLQLLQQVYISDQSGHSRGSTVDLTIVWLRATPTSALPREWWRIEPGSLFREWGKVREGAADGHDGCGAAASSRGGALDMGSGFDCFDPVSNTANESITDEQRANRLRLKAAMKRAGFYNYHREWWHYILNREPYPETYFDFEVR